MQNPVHTVDLASFGGGIDDDVDGGSRSDGRAGGVDGGGADGRLWLQLFDCCDDGALEWRAGEVVEHA